MILTKEIIAASSKIFTKRSSNCSKTSCHIVLPVNKHLYLLTICLQI